MNFANILSNILKPSLCSLHSNCCFSFIPQFLYHTLIEVFKPLPEFTVQHRHIQVNIHAHTQSHCMNFSPYNSVAFIPIMPLKFWLWVLGYFYCFSWDTESIMGEIQLLCWLSFPCDLAQPMVSKWWSHLLSKAMHEEWVFGTAVSTMLEWMPVCCVGIFYFSIGYAFIPVSGQCTF